MQIPGRTLQKASQSEGGHCQRLACLSFQRTFFLSPAVHEQYPKETATPFTYIKTYFHYHWSIALNCYLTVEWVCLWDYWGGCKNKAVLHVVKGVTWEAVDCSYSVFLSPQGPHPLENKTVKMYFICLLLRCAFIPRLVFWQMTLLYCWVLEQLVHWGRGSCLLFRTVILSLKQDSYL